MENNLSERKGGENDIWVKELKNYAKSSGVI